MDALGKSVFNFLKYSDIRHGCRTCYVEDDVFMNKTIQMRQFESEERIKAIESKGIEVQIVWEHEIREQVSKDKELRLKFQHMIDYSPIDPRDGYYGGKVAL